MTLSSDKSALCYFPLYSFFQEAFVGAKRKFGRENQETRVEGRRRLRLSFISLVSVNPGHLALVFHVDSYPLCYSHYFVFKLIHIRTVTIVSHFKLFSRFRVNLTDEAYKFLKS